MREFSLRHVVRPAVVALVLLLAGPYGLAERRALLVGITEYGAPGLSFSVPGPRNDVAALRRLLVDQYRFPPANVTVLEDSRATKRGILDAIRRLVDESRPGDQVFLYYSGHGTSLYQTDWNLPMKGTTGALVPSDFAVDTAGPEATLQRLILGDRDLRPLFAELDRKCGAFIVFDTCYSGNSVRGGAHSRTFLPKAITIVPPGGKTRGATRGATVTRGVAGDFLSDSPIAGYSGTAKDAGDEAYPYGRIIYFSASNEREPAGVDPRTQSSFFTARLVDGLKGSADTDGNGRLEYRELFGYVLREVNRETTQTPQMKQPPAPAAGKDLSCGEVLGVPDPVLHRAEAPGPDAVLRVNLVGVTEAEWREAGGASSGLSLTPGEPYHFRVAREAGGCAVYLGSGDRVCTLPGVREAAARLKGAAETWWLVDRKNPAQTFNVRFSLGRPDEQAYFQGRDYDLRFGADRPSSVVAVNIDSLGIVTVLIPGGDIREGRVEPGRDLVLPDFAEIKGPNFGTEYIKTFALTGGVEGLAEFAGEEMDPLAKPERLRQFRAALQTAMDRGPWAETLRVIVTVKATAAATRFVPLPPAGSPHCRVAVTTNGRPGGPR